MRKRYIQHPQTLQLIPEEEYYREQSVSSAAIVTDSIDGFRADATPDRPYIDSKSKLRKYCKENGLTLAADCTGLPVLYNRLPHDMGKARQQIGEILRRQLWS